MDIHKIFHMKGGLGDTSYSINSTLQKRAADKAKHITADAIEQMYVATRPTSIGIADLGCSSGPNALSNVKKLVRAVETAATTINRTAPEFRVYLNDLPTNDFNTIFQALPNWHRDLQRGRGLGNDGSGSGSPSIYIAGCPGTFYGRLFPDNSLHFIYSSNSLHWLSRVPRGIYDEKGASMNKKSLYISERSPPEVSRAYTMQFQEDFSVFLKSRSKEVVTGGRMVLILLGRRGRSHVDRETSFLWELLYQSLAEFAIQGEFSEEMVDEYDVHFYAPTKEELEDEIRKEGSFKVDMAETLEMDHELDYSGGIYASYGSAVAKTVRSIQESMIAHHFGVGEAVLDKVFEHYGRLIDQQLSKYDDKVKSISTLIVLTKM